MISPDQIEELIKAASEARGFAKAFVSNYPVGAALLTVEGKVFTGCNIECVAFNPTLHAEQVALAKALSEGIEHFTAIAVVTRDGGFCCGYCRQFMSNYVPDEFLIIAANHEGDYSTRTFGELLPERFGIQNLKSRQSDID